MRLIENASIRVKLHLLSFTVTTVALLLASGAFTLYDLQQLRSSKVEQLRMLGVALARNANTALENSDVEQAEKLLTSFMSKSSVESACIYDKEGNVFATYPATPDANVATIEVDPGGSPVVTFEQTVALRDAAGDPLALNHFQGGAFTPEGDKKLRHFARPVQ